MRKTDAIQNSVNRIGNFFKVKMPRTVGLLDMGLAKLYPATMLPRKQVCEFEILQKKLQKSWNLSHETYIVCKSLDSEESL